MGMNKLIDGNILVLDGKKQLPFGMLVGRLPNACRSGDLKECAYVTV
jgi:hypothetical protein